MLALLLEESGRRRAPCRGFTAQRAEPQRWEPCPHALPARSPNVKRRHVKVSSWHGRSAASPGWAGAPQPSMRFGRAGRVPLLVPKTPPPHTGVMGGLGGAGAGGVLWGLGVHAGCEGARGVLAPLSPPGWGHSTHRGAAGWALPLRGLAARPRQAEMFWCWSWGRVNRERDLLANEIPAAEIARCLLRSHGGGEGGPSASAEDGREKKKKVLAVFIGLGLLPAGNTRGGFSASRLENVCLRGF